MDIFILVLTDTVLLILNITPNTKRYTTKRTTKIPIPYGDTLFDKLLQTYRIGIGRTVSEFQYKYITKTTYNRMLTLASNLSSVDAFAWAFNIMEEAGFYNHRHCLCESILRALVSVYNTGLSDDTLDRYRQNIVDVIDANHNGISPQRLKDYANYHYNCDSRTQQERENSNMILLSCGRATALCAAS